MSNAILTMYHAVLNADDHASAKCCVHCCDCTEPSKLGMMYAHKLQVRLAPAGLRFDVVKATADASL